MRLGRRSGRFAWPPAGLLFLLVVPLALHLAYSWMGYNPTDDGFVLAYARRILEGQIPHRDFISIRPAGSAYLHAPLVLLAGKYAYWLSRYVVWLQLAVVSWCWVSLIDQGARLDLSKLEKIALAFLGIAFCENLTLHAIWHTTDGLFLTTLGIYLAARRGRRSILFGYGLLGAAVVCKQSFVFVAPVVLLLIGDWRSYRAWLAMALPGLAYLLMLVVSGAFGDAWLQLTAHSELKKVGFDRFYDSVELLRGGVLGFLAAAMLARDDDGERRWLHWLRVGVGAAVLAGIVIVAARAIVLRHFAKTTFLMFGATGGLTVAYLFRKEREMGRLGLLTTLCAWSVALSIGAPSPSRAGGLLAIFLLAVSYRALQRLGARSEQPLRIVLCTLCAFAALHWTQTRGRVLYRERPSRDLTCSLDGIFPGARHIRSNPNTCKVLADLHQVVANLGGRRYAIVPDFPGYWVEAKQANPLVIDWPQKIELTNPKLRKRVFDQVRAERGKLVFIVQKFLAADFSKGKKRKMRDGGGFYPIVGLVKHTYHKVGESEFFELYQ